MSVRVYFSNFSMVLLVIFFLAGLFMYTNIAKKSFHYIILITFMLSLAAFFFNPIKAWITNGNYTDLYRFYKDMDVFRHVGFTGESSSFLTGYNNVLIIKFLVYAISWTGIYGLLPAFTGGVVYGGYGLTLHKVRKYSGISQEAITLAFLMFVILTNYKVAITNIRMPIGMTLFFLITYLELVEKKKNWLIKISYLLLCAIHFVFIVFILFRLIVHLMGKYSKLIVYVIAVASGLMISVFQNFLARFSGAYITNLLYKINFYTTGAYSEYYEIPIVVLGILKITILLLILYKLNGINNSFVDENRKFYDLSNIICIFSIGTIWNYYLFMRITNYLNLLIPFWICIFLCRDKKSHIANFKKLKFSYFEFLIFCVLVIHFAYYFLSYQYRILCF